MTTDGDKPSWAWQETPAMVVDGDGMRPETMRSRRHVDGYAWDEWEQRAKAEGLGADLANLGRAVMRGRAGPSERADADTERFIAQQRAAATLREARWGTGDADRMTRLARRFPSMQDAAGVEPWDVDRFLGWACDARSDLTGVGFYVVRFLLQVWGCRTNWRDVATRQGLEGGHLEPFNAVQACATWDEAHRLAFLSWVEVPFYPLNGRGRSTGHPSER